MFLWLPHTDGFWNKLIHTFDHKFTAFKNRSRPIILKTLLVLMAITAAGYFTTMLYKLF